jgi:hypothetical protein
MNSNSKEGEGVGELKDELKLPLNDKDALDFENKYVHKIYNEIADHFSQT